MSLKHRIKLLYQKKVKKMTNSDIIIEHLRRVGTDVGEGCFIFSDKVETQEPYLVSIGNNVTIAERVYFTTHDDSVESYFKRDTLIVGKIHIADNCFIGVQRIILPGVTIAERCVIGAGSVVTKSFLEEGSVIAGVPAKKIGTVEELYQKNSAYIMDTTGLDVQEIKEFIISHPEILKKV